MNTFQSAIRRENDQRPPVWFMRQAGRYHSHYQKLKEKHTFMELCRVPELAREVTFGPIDDFGFDAAILFSDLLFPLEAMGMGLEYSPGPQLGWHLKSKTDLARLKGGRDLANHMEFQAQALRLIRKDLSPEKGLIGFVGGPMTLFFYAAAGSHQGDLEDARLGLRDGRFEGFMERLVDLLAENMALQARAGADALAMFDTCAGEVDAETYASIVVPAIAAVLERFKNACPDVPVIYYSKKTGPEHWKSLAELPIACKGIDWKHDLANVLSRWGDRWAIQGNIDPDWLFLEGDELERRLRNVFSHVLALPSSVRRGWICGLGHGVLQTTPVENVRRFLKVQREMFSS